VVLGLLDDRAPRAGGTFQLAALLVVISAGLYMKGAPRRAAASAVPAGRVDPQDGMLPASAAVELRKADPLWTS